MGAGRVALNKAIYAPLTIDETAENFFAMGNDPVQAVNLNIPSINAPVMPGRLTTTRVVTNSSGLRERYRASSDAPNGSTIEVTPKNFTVGPGESRTLTITIESDAPIGEQQFGAVRLVRRDGGGRLHLPVAFVHTQGSVNLTQSCAPETVQEKESRSAPSREPTTRSTSRSSTWTRSPARTRSCGSWTSTVPSCWTSITRGCTT